MVYKAYQLSGAEKQDYCVHCRHKDRSCKAWVKVRLEDGKVVDRLCRFCAIPGREYCGRHSHPKIRMKKEMYKPRTAQYCQKCKKSQRCAATKANGEECHNCAEKGGKYCKRHSKANLDSNGRVVRSKSSSGGSKKKRSSPRKSKAPKASPKKKSPAKRKPAASLAATVAKPAAPAGVRRSGRARKARQFYG